MNKKTKRPFVFVCAGMSLDGKLSVSKRIQTEIATNDDKVFFYDNRVLCDAIMVGGKTLILDDPSLTVKFAKRQKQRLALGKTKEPVKIGIISDISKLKLNGDFFNKGDARKILFTTERSPRDSINEIRKLCDVYVYGKQKVNLKKVLAKLYTLGMKSVMAEGGGELIFSLLKDNLVDEMNLKIGDLILGGRNAPTLCDGEGFSALTAKQVKLVDVKRKGNCLMLKYKVVKK